MAKNIAVVGTLDTKGEEILYLKKRIEERSQRVIVIDAGILGEPLFRPTFTREEVAQAAGRTLRDIIEVRHEGEGIASMAAGAAKIVAKLHGDGNLHGAIGLGASMGTFLGLTVMKALPIGLPKLVISTIAYSPMINPDYVCNDLMMMQWTGGFWGLNSLSRKVLDRAAEMIVAAASAHEKVETRSLRIGVTSLGIRACEYMTHLKPLLEDKGYELVAFHADGMGGRVFEQAIAEGLIDASLDLSGWELANEVCGGGFSAGSHRLEAAGQRGIPQVVAPGGIDTFALPSEGKINSRFRKRFNHMHNPLMRVIATSVHEQAAVGQLMAQKLNGAKGPAVVVIPMRGFSREDAPGGLWNNPAGHKAFCRALKNSIRDNIDVIELDLHINEPGFSEVVATLIHDMIEKTFAGSRTVEIH